jgi:hypothetical protein
MPKKQKESEKKTNRPGYHPEPLPIYDLTKHNLEMHTHIPKQHTLVWYETFTPRGDPKCPVCGAKAEVVDETVPVTQA